MGYVTCTYKYILYTSILPYSIDCGFVVLYCITVYCHVVRWARRTTSYGKYDRTWRYILTLLGYGNCKHQEVKLLYLFISHLQLYFYKSGSE